MADIPTPEGYIKKAVPRSQKEAISAKAHDRVKTIAKNALENYIRSFLDTEGGNRKLVNVMSPQMLNFITDKSIEVDDPRSRSVQLARLFNDVREQMPAILIVDSGYQWLPNSLGSLDAARVLRDEDGELQWIARYHITAKISVTVAVASNDQDTTDMMGTFLNLIFGQVRNISGGSRMHSPRPGDNWEVRIPLEFSPSPTQGENVTEDRKDQIWATNIEIPLDFEDSFLFKQPYVGYTADDAANGQSGPLSLPPIISVPDTIQVNQPTKFTLDRYRISHRISVDDPSIATLDVENCVINPRKLGSFRLQIRDISQTQGPGTMNAAPVVVEKLITVVL